MKMDTRRLILAVFAAFSISCQSGGYYQTVEISPPEAPLSEKIEKDILVTVQNNFPPAKTRIYFPHQDEKLASALEGSLRRLGYGVSREALRREKGDIQLAYKLSQLSDDLFVLRLVVGESFQINRIYERKSDGDFMAAGPLFLRKG